MTYELAIAELKRRLPELRDWAGPQSAIGPHKVVEAVEAVLHYDERKLPLSSLTEAQRKYYLDVMATDSCKVTKPIKE